jgi:hypothetical protein
MREFRVEACEATTMLKSKVWYENRRVSRLRFGVFECLHVGLLLF